ncbi:MAG: SCO family protein [Pseudomonadota bacterium]
MNRHANTHPLRTAIASALAASALILAGCSSQAEGPSADGVDLRGADLGGDFTLTSNEGEKVSWSDFDGQYRLVYFGFTYCPDICPTDVQRFSQGLSQFEETNPDLGKRIQPVFISVDPDRDTPEVLDQFVGNFHPRLIGLTGTNEEIEQVKAKFKVAATKEPANEEGWYNVAHTPLTYLYDPTGEPLGVIPTDKMAEGVAAELERWIR